MTNSVDVYIRTQQAGGPNVLKNSEDLVYHLNKALKAPSRLHNVLKALGCM